jgi:hypothetical protein
LPVEDSCDDRVGVMDGQAADQLDRVVIGADLGLGPFERNRQVADRATFPADLQLGAAGGAIGWDGDDDVVQEGVQQLFAVLFGGARRGPDPLEILTQGQDRGALGGAEGSGAAFLAAGQLGLGGAARVFSQSASRPRATSRLSGSTAR